MFIRLFCKHPLLPSHAQWRHSPHFDFILCSGTRNNFYHSKPTRTLSSTHAIHTFQQAPQASMKSHPNVFNGWGLEYLSSSSCPSSYSNSWEYHFIPWTGTGMSLYTPWVKRKKVKFRIDSFLLSCPTRLKYGVPGLEEIAFVSGLQRPRQDMRPYRWLYHPTIASIVP